MGTPNHGAHTPAAGHTPKTVGAIPGLKNKIMTALAAIGLAASADKVDGAVIILNEVPGAVSGPTLQPGGASFVTQSTLGGVDVRLSSPQTIAGAGTTPNTVYQATSRFSVTIPLGQDGTLSVSWTGRMGTGAAPEANGQGFTGSTFDVNQRFLFGHASGPINEIGNINGLSILNASGSSVAWPSEGYNMFDTFNEQFNVVQGQTYYFDMNLDAVNTNSFGQIENLQFSFQGVPEPSSSVLAGGTLAALLLRRRRETEKGKSE